jgi:hypothetical protein
MSQWYLLDENNVPQLADTSDLASYFEKLEPQRRIAFDSGEFGGHIVKVSTVFLGLDHSWGGGAPLVFETMIFGGEHSDYQERCSTYEGALKMHKVAMALVEKTP